MTFDDEIIPEHNLVSSEWEKNERIRASYHRARLAMLPKLIDLLETHVGDRVWAASDDLFHSPIPLELWSRPEYRVVHAASSGSGSGSGSSANRSNNNDDSDNNSNNSSCDIHGTTTEFFLEKQQQELTKRSKSSVAKMKSKAKPKKNLPDKCLLRHEFSTGCFSFMVCKLQRRHQKEIAKHPPFGSSSSSPLSPSQPPVSSAVLEGLARSVVLKQYTKLSKTNHLSSISKGQSNTEALATSTEDAKTSEYSAGADGNEDPHDQPSVLQEEAKTIVTDALSIVRAAKNLQVGVVPVTTLVRWKAEEEFEIRYFD